MTHLSQAHCGEQIAEFVVRAEMLKDNSLARGCGSGLSEMLIRIDPLRPLRIICRDESALSRCDEFSRVHAEHGNVRPAADLLSTKGCANRARRIFYDMQSMLGLKTVQPIVIERISKDRYGHYGLSPRRDCRLNCVPGDQHRVRLHVHEDSRRAK